jgi:transcriptional regulator with XRE-family HTH domain
LGYQGTAGHNPAVLKDASYRRAYAQFLVRLKQARAEAALTQVEVANRINRPQSFVSKIESGERRVDVLELSELATIYRKSLDFFLP